MIYFFLLAACIIFFSFLTGVLVKKYCRISDKYFSFSSPIGFFVLCGVLQIGYFVITYFDITYLLGGNLYIDFTVLIMITILFFSIINYKYIFKALFTINIIKIVIALILVVIFIYLFSTSEINYRLDDINFYGDFIRYRLYHTGIVDINYSLQGYFVLLSILIEYGKNLTALGIYTSFYPIASIIWVPAIITAWVISFILVDFFDYSFKKIKSLGFRVFIWVLVVLIFILDFWYFEMLNSSLVLRRFAIPLIIVLLSNLRLNNKLLSNSIMISLIIGGFISISSSAFFVSSMILFAYFFYLISTKSKNYLISYLILTINPFIFALAYVKNVFNSGIFIYLLILVYLVVWILCLSKIRVQIEKFLNKYFKFIFLFFIVLFYGLVFLIPVNKYLMMGDRTFFWAINKFDSVPNLISGLTLFETIFNCLYWGLLTLTIGIMIYKKRNNWYLLLVSIVLLFFFNPISYDFVVSVFTGAAYFRITDILFNIIILYELVIYLYEFNRITKYLIIICSLLMLSCRVINFDFEFSVNEENFNTIYHTSNIDMNVINKLSEEYLKYDNKDEINIASQIYGGQFFSNFNINNQLEDRFSYAVRDESEYERVFYRREPGFEDLSVDYEHACTLAFENQTDYVILEAQYNWKLQEGLWPCSELLFELENYRVLKMNYEYWEWNIQQGYTQKFDLDGE